MSSSNCCFLTCIQVSHEASQVVWYSHLFQNFPQFIVIHTVKGFAIVNKAEIDVFLELSFDDPVDIGNLISGSSAFFKASLNIWKITVHVLLKPGLDNFKYYFTGVWDKCNCTVVWTFFGIAFLWDWNENWPFPVLWPLLSFPNLLVFWEQHLHSTKGLTDIWCPLEVPLPCSPTLCKLHTILLHLTYLNLSVCPIGWYSLRCSLLMFTIKCLYLTPAYTTVSLAFGGTVKLSQLIQQSCLMFLSKMCL